MTLSFMVKQRDPDLILSGTNVSENKLNRYAGIDGDTNPQITQPMNVPLASETHYGCAYSAGMRLGPMRLGQGPRGSGLKYGGGVGQFGTTACGMVDLYAGINSAGAHTNKISKEIPVNPDPTRDAARVLITQKCNIDDQFSLSDGTIGNIQNKSAVALKGDQARMIGRNGVKIVTGTDKYNSQGRRIISVAPINLIAGNAPPDMIQPIPRGNNLRDALKAMSDRVNQLAGILNHFLQSQQSFNSALATHVHPDPISMGLAVCAGQEPTAFFNGETFESWDCLMAGFYDMCDGLRIKKDLMFHKGAMAGFEIEHLNPTSTKYINSRQVSTS